MTRSRLQLRKMFKFQRMILMCCWRCFNRFISRRMIKLTWGWGRGRIRRRVVIPIANRVERERSRLQLLIRSNRNNNKNKMKTHILHYKI